MFPDYLEDAFRHIAGAYAPRIALDLRRWRPQLDQDGLARDIEELLLPIIGAVMDRHHQ